MPTQAELEAEARRYLAERLAGPEASPSLQAVLNLIHNPQFDLPILDQFRLPTGQTFAEFAARNNELIAYLRAGGTVAGYLTARGLTAYIPPTGAVSGVPLSSVIPVTTRTAPIPSTDLVARLFALRAAPPAPAAPTVPQPVPFAPVVTGEPVSSVVLTVISAIASLFGIFGRGVGGAVKDALDTMRRTIQTLSEQILSLAFGFGGNIWRIFRPLKSLYADVLRPLLEAVRRVSTRITRAIDQVLARHQAMLDRIRWRILQIYRRFFAPILAIIQSIRRVFAVLAALHVPFARRVDRWLAELQARIASPILALLRRTNQHSYVLNYLLTIRGLLQAPVLIGSVIAELPALVSVLWRAHSRRDPGPAVAALRARYAPMTPAQAEAAVVQYLATGQGPMAVDVDAAVAIFDRVSRGLTV